jgi:hypothetical protein
MSKTAIANIGENDFDDWRQMFVDLQFCMMYLQHPRGWRVRGLALRSNAS